MSGICGWIGKLNMPLPASEAVRLMVGGLPSEGSTRSETTAFESAALAMRSTTVDGAWHCDAGAGAAIVGYPVWTRAELADVARDAGHAAALLHAYRMHGTDLLQHLRGSFALAVVDGARAEALVAIDRIGIEPLAYSVLPSGAVVFGSTTDAIRRHPTVTATINPQSVFDFFYFVDRIPAPRTIYKEQRKLLPGELLHVRNGHADVRRYWRMPYTAVNSTPTAELHAELLERFYGAVKGTIAAEDPGHTGAFLSGGLDSSSVVGMLTKAAGRPARAFSIGFDAEGFDEMDYARIAARHFRAEHHEYYVTPADVLDVIQKIAAAYDEPFANSSAVPVYCCARLAREHGIDLMLAGDGGDELFAGNKRYVDDSVFAAYSRLPESLRRALVEPFVAALPATTWIGRKGRRFLERAAMTVPQLWSQDNLFATVQPDDVFEGSFLGAVDRQSPAALMEEMHRDGKAETALQRMLQLDLRLTIADSDIRKVNRMCQLAGVRVRYPFFNDDLVEFSAHIPPQVLMPGNELRGFYKDATKGFLPAEILAKKKHGFGLPYITFVARHPPLRDLAYDTLSAFKRRGIMRPGFIDKAISMHSAGQGNGVASAVWDIITLELWLQGHSDRPAAAV